MKKSMTVAILLATYNGEKYIRTQIDSIINQTYTNWKIFLSDDGSTDSTLSILKDYVLKYPEKIVLLSKEKPTGSAKKNFMYMLSCVKDYDYVMCCDQDDFWISNKIEITLQKMLEIEKDTSKPCLVHTDLEVVDGELNTISNSFFEFSSLSGERDKWNNLLIQNIVTGCTMMINHAMVDYAMRNCNVDKILMHDWWIALIAACIGNIGFVNQPTIRYRQHGNNSVGAKNSKDVSYILQQVNKGKKNTQAIIDTMIQAEEFVNVFENDIEKDIFEKIRSYAQLRNESKLKKLVFIVKNDIWKNGFARKIAQIIFI